jgi:acetyl esterase/lipase
MRIAAAALATCLLLTGCLGLGPPREIAEPNGVAITRDIVYGDAAGRALHLDLYRAADVPATTQQPVIVWIFGGGWLRGSKDVVPLAPLALRGVTIASIEYRLSDEAIFPAQIHDVKAAIRFLRANADRLGLDPHRLCVFGGSAGGHLAALAATAPPGDPFFDGTLGNPGVDSRPDSAVILFPAADLNRLDFPENHIDVRIRVAVRKMLGSIRTIDMAAAAAASPVTWIDRSDPPALVVHGDQDTLIDKEQGILLHDTFVNAGVSSQLLIVPGAGHGNRMLGRPDVQQVIGRFLADQLRVPGLAAVDKPTR